MVVNCRHCFSCCRRRRRSPARLRAAAQFSLDLTRCDEPTAAAAASAVSAVSLLQAAAAAAIKLACNCRPGGALFLPYDGHLRGCLIASLCVCAFTCPGRRKTGSFHPPAHSARLVEKEKETTTNKNRSQSSSSYCAPMIYGYIHLSLFFCGRLLHFCLGDPWQTNKRTSRRMRASKGSFTTI